MAVPVYGSVFVYGAASAPDKLRLSGPAPTSPVGDDPWYGDSGDYGLPVDQWSSTTHTGYPTGPVGPTWVPNASWLYGVSLPVGTYTRIVKPHWLE